MSPQPIGTIRKVELRDTLLALALARPDLAEPLALVAVATGLSEHFKLPRQASERQKLEGREQWPNY